MQIKTFLGKIRSFFTRKRTIWTVVVLLIIFFGWLIFGRKSSNSNIQTAVAKKQDIQKTVLTTGQVVSQTDLSLSFQSNGVVRRINVKEGDKVYEGQILASLDSASAYASLEQAQANYEKIKAGATTQDVSVSQSAVDSAQITLDNAKQNLINHLQSAYADTNTAVLTYTNILFASPQTGSPQFSLPGTVQTDSTLTTKVNSDRVAVNGALASWQGEIATINDSNVDQVVNDSIKFANIASTYFADIISLLTNNTQITYGGSQTALATYQANVAGAKSTTDTAITAILTYSQSVKSAKSSLLQAQSSLSLKQSPARQEDVDAALASVHSAQAVLNNTLIIAPTNGTLTSISIKLGEQAQATKEVMRLLDTQNLHTEAQVSEADIASVKVGQTIDNTFDALGPDRHFQSKVLTVNPASTVISGVVNYKVTGSLENISEVKPGMTANMTILVSQQQTALVVPSSAIVNRDGKKWVKVIDDPKKKTYHELEVFTGLEADGGLTEIIGASDGRVSEGTEVVTYIK